MSNNRGLILVGLGVAILVAVASVFLASGSPDGLERVATDSGFIDSAEGADYELLPGYTLPGIEDQRVSTAIAGAIGIALVAGLTWGVATLVRRRTPSDDEGDEASSRPPAS